MIRNASLFSPMNPREQGKGGVWEGGGEGKVRWEGERGKSEDAYSEY